MMGRNLAGRPLLLVAVQMFRGLDGFLGHQCTLMGLWLHEAVTYSALPGSMGPAAASREMSYGPIPGPSPLIASRRSL